MKYKDKMKKLYYHLDMLFLPFKKVIISHRIILSKFQAYLWSVNPIIINFNKEVTTTTIKNECDFFYNSKYSKFIEKKNYNINVVKKKLLNYLESNK